MVGASALVLLLSIPALGLYYSGQADRKNVLSICIQLGIVAAVTALLWVVVGYTLAFGQVSLQGWLGGGRAWM
ncbi:MAG TPA: ammonia channel protein, partial [Paracoccaceae bacterium]|nr:ammonia channel protein [Paracoccaceae bacterium]